MWGVCGVADYRDRAWIVSAIIGSTLAQAPPVLLLPPYYRRLFPFTACLRVQPPGAFDLCKQPWPQLCQVQAGQNGAKLESTSRSRFCFIGYIGSKVDAITSSCSDRSSMWRCRVLQNRLYNHRMWDLLLIVYPVSPFVLLQKSN